MAGQHYEYIVKQLKDFRARDSHQRRGQHDRVYPGPHRRADRRAGAVHHQPELRLRAWAACEAPLHHRRPSMGVPTTLITHYAGGAHRLPRLDAGAARRLPTPRRHCGRAAFVADAVRLRRRNLARLRRGSIRASAALSRATMPGQRWQPVVPVLDLHAFTSGRLRARPAGAGTGKFALFALLVAINDNFRIVVYDSALAMLVPWSCWAPGAPGYAGAPPRHGCSPACSYPCSPRCSSRAACRSTPTSTTTTCITSSRWARCTFCSAAPGCVRRAGTLAPSTSRPRSRCPRFEKNESARTALSGAARLPPRRLLRVGRRRESARSRLRTWLDAQWPRLRCAGARPGGRLPRDMPRRGRAWAQPLAEPQAGLRLSAPTCPIMAALLARTGADRWTGSARRWEV